MVPNEPPEHPLGSFQRGDLGQEPTQPRIYDSFIVRLWREGNSATLLRAEVEHVQTGLLIGEIQVPLEWVLSAIYSCLQPPVPHQPDDADGNLGHVAEEIRGTGD